MAAEPDKAERDVMRAIVTRHHRQAVAERREAQAVHAAEHAAAVPKPVGWNSRPTKQDTKRDELCARERVARKARRVPEDKAIGRALRERDKRWDHKTNATSATMESADADSACVEARTRQGSLARLFVTRAIDEVQLASAVDIATVAERIRRDVAVKTASLETRIDAGHFGGDHVADELLGAVRRESAFTAWRDALGASARLALDMIVDDAGVVVVARRHRVGRLRALMLLVDALDRWPAFMREAARTIDDRDLAAAHARLA